MNKIFFRRTAITLALAAVLAVFASSSFGQYTNGIYAEFNTSIGSYTCSLYYAYAPKAVANFIGLATGQRAWLDLPSGVVKTNPFYNGTTFHRVITNFVIQGGSPNGQGTDGPGYAFVDEFTNSLRFDRFGVLAMANSGPDSNGSQFFNTISNAPNLNDVHTIFGRLFGGSNVVYAINRVATDANNKPLTNVYLNSVIIRRVGTEANNFDVASQGLPLVTNLNLEIAKTGTNVSLTFSNRLYADNRLYSSSNLTQWAEEKLGIEIAAPVSNSVVRNTTAPSRFFRMAQVQYPLSTLAPKNLFGRTMTLNISDGHVLTVVFDSSGGGAYTFTGSPDGTVQEYVWLQEPYRGRLWPIKFSGLNDMTYRLDFETTTTGTFAGTVYSFPPFTNGGNFTLTGP